MKKFANEKQCINDILEAMKSGDEEKIKQAWGSFHNSIAEEVRKDFEELQASNDSTILVQRGYRQLTSHETKWYQKVIAALKSSDPKQAFLNIIGSEDEEDVMPSTIIEDVYKHLQEDHELLNAINFQYVGYITKWILNDHSAQNAIWGNITAEITKEITSSFKIVDVNQNKLSAFAVIEQSMLDLGPVFLDGYIRKVLSEAIATGVEFAIVKGTGVNEPIGFVKDIHEGVSYSSTTGYPNKEAISVNDFTPKTYGGLVAKLAVTENGKKRKFSKVALICNMVDYLTKVMPATTLLNGNGTYVNNLFPFPTDIFISNALEDGEAVLCLPNEYFLGMGGSKNGVIEYDDSYKFLEDQRVFKVKQYGAGRAYDNTSAILLDISEIEEAIITVKTKENVPTA